MGGIGSCRGLFRYGIGLVDDESVVESLDRHECLPAPLVCQEVLDPAATGAGKQPEFAG
jgi:hypothetical protein